MVSEYEETQLASRNENVEKEIPTKAEGLEQGEKHDPRLVSFCKKITWKKHWR